MAQLQNLIGKYRIVEELSSGSFGRVYRAEDTSRKNAPVAIKLLHAAHVKSSQERNGFLQEARFLTLLRHPHILQVLDVGIEQDFPYLVTEFAPNGSLLARLQQQAPRPLPLADALHILAQVGQALYYAHQQNIIHRDLKPANILFDAHGDALLADFGIATMLANSSEHGTAIGTPFYMAPEQFRGTISKESDQYALACIAYELVTGRQPFTATDFFSLGYKHMSETPIAPCQLNLLVTRPVESAILRAMAKQRNDRFPDIAAFMAALGVPIAETAPVSSPIIPVTPLPSVFDEEHEETIPAHFHEEEDESDLTIRRVLSPGESLLTLGADQPSIISPSIVHEHTGELPVVATLSYTGSPARNSIPLYTGAEEEDTPRAFSPADSLPREITPGFFARTTVAGPPSTPMPHNDGNEEEEEEEGFPFPPTPEGPFPFAGDDEEDDVPATFYQSASLPLTQIAPATAPSKPRRKRRLWLIVAAACLLVLLLAGSAFAALYVTSSSFRHSTTAITNTIRKHLPVIAPPPPTATVTITPVQKNLSYNYNILAVGSPNSANQVSERFLSNATGWQSRTIPATGQGNIPATYATGTVNIANQDQVNSITIPAGTGFTINNYSFTITSDVNLGPSSSTDVGAQAANPGSDGNIPSNYFGGLQSWGSSTIYIYNDAPFTGGQDQQNYTYVQQSDMNAAQAAANQLKASLMASARATVLRQMYGGESLYGQVQCSTLANFDHGVGDRVSSITTSVSAKCSATVYNLQAALTMGANLLAQQVSTVPTASYKLLSKISTSVVSVSGVRSGILIVVNATSVGLFQFSKGQRQELISLIVGKSEQDARAILASQTGVGSVNITLANATNALLPADAKDITINVVGS